MDLDYRQTRRLYLAGTVPFPMLFPTVGTITIEDGNLSYSNNGQIITKLLVIVREKPGPEHATTRVILAKHVAAIFFPAGEGNRVDDFEDGEWVLGPNIRADADRRGIVFVPEYRPVLTNNEITQTAGSVGAPQVGYSYGCDCCNW
jgi:hypothetical protein